MNRRHHLPWLVLLLAGPAAAETPLPPAQKAVDYRTPARAYDAVAVAGRTVYVEHSLAAAEPATANQALDRLGRKLDLVFAAFPEAARGELRRLDLFVMYGSKAPGDGRDTGLEYFAPGTTRVHTYTDPRWDGGIVIYCAANYTRIPDLIAGKVLAHEYAHARHLLHRPAEDAEVVAAWKQAVERRLYLGVPDLKGASREKGYAATNQLEYFAELSAKYFVGCDYKPFGRDELKAYDPVGYELVERLWGVTKE